MWIICPECCSPADPTAFERPPCSDGHGDQCPEWCCVTCGHAMIEGEIQLLAPPPPAMAHAREHRRAG